VGDDQDSEKLQMGHKGLPLRVGTEENSCH
jgi:hypothetical protein